MDINKRNLDLQNLQSYLQTVDKEVTMVLQSLQWDRKHLLEGKDLVSCSHDPNHKVPPDKREQHERNCILSSHGYSRADDLLPDPVDPHAPTLVKHSKMEIQSIIQKASNSAPCFKMGAGSPASPEPLSLSRLQATYSADERRALHDAVVAAAPDHGDIAELALMSVEERSQARAASKLELLAQLRDMKRRRARYRGAAGSARYSDTLRDLIKTQMELYTGVKNEPDVDKTSVGISTQTNNKQHSGYEHGNEAMQSREPKQSNKGREYDTKRREPSKEQDRYAKAEIRPRGRKKDSRSNCSKDRNYESCTKETDSGWKRDNESCKTHYRNDYDYNRGAGSSHSSRSRNRYDDYEVKQKHRTESYSKSRREQSRDRSRVRVKVESSPSRSAEQAAYVEDKKSRYEESDRRRKDSKEYSRHKSDKSKVESSSRNTQEQTVYVKEDSKSRHDKSYERQENPKEHSRSKKKKHKSHRDNRERPRSADCEPEIKQELHTRYYDCEDGE
ncbi:hypothetical protein JYU34_007164 [Plutella xylostella]|uniref:Uncharacterized protein n=1 Tax=Plutella xylostella TaxID=51655 RepID=A0ABQ7QPQ7_PLUXY|nr:hypothetical protein JYU34_007164 [Plutella xylostella]